LLTDILYFESKGRQVKMVTVKREYIFYDTLKEILPRVEGGHFIRVHKGFIVNYDHVVAYNSKYLELPNHINIPIGFSKQVEVKQAKTKWE